MTTTTPVTTSTTPVTTAATTAATSAPATTAATTAASTGLSSVSSSMSSSTPAPSQTFCEMLGSWISGAIDAIRSCLSHIPLIGKFFEKSTPVTSTATSTGTTPLPSMDQQIVNLFKAEFIAGPVAPGATPAATPAADRIAYLLAQMALITAPAAKMEAFEAVLVAQNSNQAIAKQFYDALPAVNQDGFKGELYVANGNSDVRGTVSHGFGFGDHMVFNELISDTSKQAAAHYRAALLATPATTTATTTATTATTTATTATTTTP